MTPQPTTLIGIALPHKTSNANEQAMTDCGQLWQRFEQEGIFDKIPGKTAFFLETKEPSAAADKPCKCEFSLTIPTRSQRPCRRWSGN